MVSFLTILVALLLPSLARACRCIGPPSVAQSLNVTTGVDAVFRGRVVRRLVVGTSEEEIDSQMLHYVVQVERLYKGCSAVASSSDNRIVVTTGANSALCGVSGLLRRRSYLFSAFDSTLSPSIQAQLGSANSSIKKAVSINSCNYQSVWSMVRLADRRRLRNYDNSNCKLAVPTRSPMAAAPSAPIAAPISNGKCVTGADCSSNNTQYCDAGICVAYPKPLSQCPNQVACLLAPCASFASSCAVANATCYDDYCNGGCNAIFVNVNGTRVCAKL